MEALENKLHERTTAFQKRTKECEDLKVQLRETEAEQAKEVEELESKLIEFQKAANNDNKQQTTKTHQEVVQLRKDLQMLTMINCK